MEYMRTSTKVQHLRKINPKHKYKMRNIWLSSSLAESDLAVIVDHKLDK